MSLDEIEVLWALKLLPIDKLPQTAIDLLEAGYDSQPLLELAGLSKSELTEATDLFAKVLFEIGRTPLSKREAALRYTGLISKEIILGKISPYNGAKQIWRASIGLEEPLHEVDTFVYAASEFEDRPDDRDFFADEIVKEARRWADHLRMP